MLLLTHGSPANDAQRRIFAILHELGTGPAGRRGVAVLGDGFARFGPVAGVICTPEAMAVIAAGEVTGGDGYLFAPLNGPWSIGGQTARFEDAGSNPVHEVDRALKRIVAAVRRGGLDPGYVQSLIVVHGPVSGVAQPEPERGQGVVVAPAQRRPLVEALDLATVNRSVGLSGAWTTADVTGVLEALGFDCSTLETQLFTQEGFPYSPYVLRPTSIHDTPFAREETNPGATRLLRSHASRAGTTAQPVISSADAPRPSQRAQRKTGPVQVAGPPLGSVSAPVGGMLADPTDDHAPGARRSPWRWLVPLVVLLLVVAGAWYGASALFGTGDEQTAQREALPQGGTGDGPAAQTIGGYSFEPGANDSRAQCAAHAYGEVKAFLTEQPCTRLERALFLTEVDGKPVAVSVAEVTMPDADGAAALKAMTDTSGTGNVNDLLREDVRPDGYPSAEVITGGEYASSVIETKVRIVEAAFVDGSDTTPNVDAAADAALQIEL